MVFIEIGVQVANGMFYSVHILYYSNTALAPTATTGYSTILTVVDRFSKTAHFIPVPKLPTAKESVASWIMKQLGF